MVVSSGLRLDPSISQVRHFKVQALIKDHRISKRWGGVYSDHLEYDLPQDKGDESESITFRKYLANITAKTGKYYGNQLFCAISCNKNHTTVKFIYFPRHKLESTQVLNGMPCIISK